MLQISSENFQPTIKYFRRSGKRYRISEDLTSTAEKYMERFKSVLTIEISTILKDHILKMKAHSDILKITHRNKTNRRREDTAVIVKQTIESK